MRPADEVEPEPPAVDFARRVAHFDMIVESDRDDDDDVAAARNGKPKSTDDIEKEYLIGGRTSFGDGDDADADNGVGSDAGCCARTCGNEKASKREGFNVVLAACIMSMAFGVALVYAAWTQQNAPNRQTTAFLGLGLAGLAELTAIIGLVGVCTFQDVHKTPFKLGFAVNIAQIVAQSAYMLFLLFLWDGNYNSGTQPLNSKPSVATPASGTGGIVTFLSVDESLAAAAPTDAKSKPSAKAVVDSICGTQLCFIVITALLLMCSLMYAYGSLRLRCKKMGRWGSTAVGVLLAMVALATVAFGALAVNSNRAALVNVKALAPIVAELTVSLLVVATCIYQLVVSTRVQKLKVAAKQNFNTLLILSGVCAVALGVSEYVYIQALQYTSAHAGARIDLLHLTALGGVGQQLLLLAFFVQLIAWRYALPDEYPNLGAVEKFGLSTGDDASDPFIPPPAFGAAGTAQEI